MLKLVSLALVGLELALLVTWTSGAATRASVPAAALSFADSIAVLILMTIRHSRAIRPSSLIILYLMLSILFGAAELRTLYLRQEPPAILGLSIAVIGVKVLLLLLENQNKRGYLRFPYRTYSPEATSGLINRSLFWWLNSLITTGFKKVLTLDDLSETGPGLRSEHLQERIEPLWIKCTESLKAPKPRLTKSDRSSGDYALLKASAFCFRWQIFYTMIPLLFSIGFSYAQPFLIASAVTYIGLPINEANQNTGYGLIGATALIYIGITVSVWFYSEYFPNLGTSYLAPDIFFVIIRPRSS